MKRELILIGPIDTGNMALTGDVMKNQLFLKRFEEVFDVVIPIDTINWKRRPWVLLKITWMLLTHPSATVILSTNTASADRIIRILKRISLDKRIHYWVVGGTIHKSFQSGKFNVDNYKGLRAIIVQGMSISDSLKNQGLTNAVFVPNSKYIDYIPLKKEKEDAVIHFVFLSRLETNKGCDEIIQASDILNYCGYEGKFDITFYGKTIDEEGYYEKFIDAIKAHNEISYSGTLNLRDTQNYDELAKYDVMLFPTFWHGEGFPGVVIDAYIAGLPIIASDWNLNMEVIEDGVTGWIIPVHDVQALAEKMKTVIDHPQMLKPMIAKCNEKAIEFDSRFVLSEENLRKLNLILQ